MMYYFRLFWKTLYIGITVGIIVVVSYIIYDYYNGKNIYEASVGIMVNEDVNSPYIPWTAVEADVEDGNGVITDSDFTSNLVNYAIYYVNTPKYQEVVKEKLKDTVPDIDTFDFKGNVSTSTYAGSNLVTITVRCESNSYYPVLIANTLAESYKEITAYMMGADYFIIAAEATRNATPVNMTVFMSCTFYGGGALLLTFLLILLIDGLARSEGTYLSWKLFRRRRRDVILEEGEWNENAS
jgi:capsular polysaccharide biosynthesis protein